MSADTVKKKKGQMILKGHFVVEAFQMEGVIIILHFSFSLFTNYCIFSLLFIYIRDGIGIIEEIYQRSNLNKTVHSLCIKVNRKSFYLDPAQITIHEINWRCTYKLTMFVNKYEQMFILTPQLLFVLPILISPKILNLCSSSYLCF